MSTEYYKSSKNGVQIDLAVTYVEDELPEELEGINKNIQKLSDDKVDKIDGKGLSSNDFTNENKKQLESLPSAEDFKILKQDLIDKKQNDFIIPLIEGEYDIEKDVPTYTTEVTIDEVMTAVNEGRNVYFKLPTGEHLLCTFVRDNYITAFSDSAAISMNSDSVILYGEININSETNEYKVIKIEKEEDWDLLDNVGTAYGFIEGSVMCIGRALKQLVTDGNMKVSVGEANIMDERIFFYSFKEQAWSNGDYLQYFYCMDMMADMSGNNCAGVALYRRFVHINDDGTTDYYMGEKLTPTKRDKVSDNPTYSNYLTEKAVVDYVNDKTLDKLSFIEKSEDEIDSCVGIHGIPNDKFIPCLYKINRGNGEYYYLIGGSIEGGQTFQYKIDYDVDFNYHSYIRRGCVYGTAEGLVYQWGTWERTITESDLDNKANKATTLEGYGITDAYTKTEADDLLSNYKKNDFIIPMIVGEYDLENGLPTYTTEVTIDEVMTAANEGRNIYFKLSADEYLLCTAVSDYHISAVMGNITISMNSDSNIVVERIDIGCEDTGNKVTKIDEENDSTSQDKYPNVPAVIKYVQGKTENKVDKGTIRNLFNPDDSEIEDGYYIYHNNTKYENNRCFVSGYIPVIKGKTYIFNRPYGTYGSNMVNHPYYNQNKEYTGVLKGTYEGNMCTITIPEDIDIAYIRTSYYLEEKSSYMVIEGNIYPDSYLGYNESQSYIPKDITIFADKFKDADNAIIDISPLKNKNITFNGDSICAGTGDALGGYGKIIADRYSMVYQNIAASGATIAKGTYTDNTQTKARTWICNTISAMSDRAEYAIVEGGVNDASLDVPLGTITEGYAEELNEETFYGAFESMLKQLTIKYAGKKIGYIAVHQMQNDFSAAGDEATSYYYAAKKCCEKWGVPFLDLNVSVPPLGLIHDERDDAELVALKTAYTINGDGWHPNKDGYNIYYVPKIIKWLESL